MTELYIYLVGVVVALAIYGIALYNAGVAKLSDIIVAVLAPTLSWGAVVIAVCGYIMANHDKVIWRKK